MEETYFEIISDSNIFKIGVVPFEVAYETFMNFMRKDEFKSKIQLVDSEGLVHILKRR